VVVRHRHRGTRDAAGEQNRDSGQNDVVQDAFVIAFERLRSLRNGSKFGSWLMQITKREAGRQRREHRVFRSMDATEEPSNPVDIKDTDLNGGSGLIYKSLHTFFDVRKDGLWKLSLDKQ